MDGWESVGLSGDETRGPSLRVPPTPPREVEATEGPRPWLVKWDLLCRRVQMESLAQTHS